MTGPRSLIVAFLAILFLSSCGTPGPSRPSQGRATGPRLNPNHPALLARNAAIQREPRGNFYIGRRYWIQGTRFWGFVRRPGQTWQSARLVVFNEARKLSPDRLPETGVGGRVHGFDHNYEYRLSGYFTGAEVYDPNSNQKLPEFMLTGSSLISPNPGFLFHPEQRFASKVVPTPPSL